MRNNLQERVGEQIIIWGNVQKVEDYHNDFGRLVHVCVGEVKVQHNNKIVGREDHIWVNDYQSRNNQVVRNLVDKHNVQDGERVGIRGIVREYKRRDGSIDYDLRNIDVVNVKRN